MLFWGRTTFRTLFTIGICLSLGPGFTPFCHGDNPPQPNTKAWDAARQLVRLTAEGDEMMAQPGKIPDAVRKYKEAQALFEEFVPKARRDEPLTPLIAQIKIIRTRLSMKIGQADSLIGNHLDARKSFEDSLQRLDSLKQKIGTAKISFDLTIIDFDRANALIELGTALSNLREDVQAARKQREGLQELERLQNLSSKSKYISDAAIQRVMVIAHYSLTQRCLAAGQFADALRHAEICQNEASDQAAKVRAGLLKCDVLLSLQRFDGAFRQLQQVEQLLKDSERNRISTFDDAELFISRAKVEEALGDLYQAREIYQQVSDFYSQQLPPGSMRTIAARSNLALLDVKLDNIPQAIAAYELSIQQLKERLQNNRPAHPEIIRNLLQVAGLYRQVDRLDDCAKALDLANELLQALTGTADHEQTDLQATLYAQRGHYCMIEGRYDEAGAWYQKLNHANETMFPPEQFPNGHPDLASGLSDLGRAAAAEGDFETAFRTISASLEIRLKLWRTKTLLMSVQESLSHQQKLMEYLDALLTVTPNTKAGQDAVYALCFEVRHAVFNSLAAKQQVLAASQADGEIRSGLESLDEIREQLTHYSGDIFALSDSERQTLQSILDRRTQVEQELTISIVQYLEHTQRKSPAPNELAEKLPADAAFVDIVRYQQSSDARYVAFIIRNGYPIKQVEIGAAGNIDRTIRQWLELLLSNRRISPDLSRQVYSRIWKRIGDQLSGVRTILIAPDGAYYGVPWAAIPVEGRHQYLIGQHSLVTVPSGQYLLHLLTSPRKELRVSDTLLAITNVSYGIGNALKETVGGEEGLQKLKRKKEMQESLDAAVERTQLEYLGEADANCATVLSRLPFVRWALFDTHAYFRAPEAGAIDYLSTEFPMLNCGLVLSPANETGLQGVLTGEEFANMDLSNLDFAALLACWSATGKVVDGEGVFSFQRAFHLAGCRCVLGSLWAVGERSTDRMMSKLQGLLFKDGMPVAEALRKVQLEAMNSSDFLPSVWAAWTLSGDAWLTTIGKRPRN